MDKFTESIMNRTAEAFAKLCGLRGVSACIEVVAGRFVCNGESVGTSIHSAYAWLDRQPGVRP